MSILVFHRLDACRGLAVTCGRLDPEQFILVAVVDTDSFATAFCRTQNFETEWVSHFDVEAMGQDHRSTNMGDLMAKIDFQPPEDGIFQFPSLHSFMWVDASGPSPVKEVPDDMSNLFKHARLVGTQLMGCGDVGLQKQANAYLQWAGKNWGALK